ncbi:MAG: ribbon-helix-helix protein, CopG family [Terriglobia bacterium]|jgi:metal-responsive CopG/Arc/MetJ family transcriptional regulator
METIQVVLDSELLKATDSAAKRARVNRSALVRQALREHLRGLKIKELEARERRAYQEQPQDIEEVEHWAGVAVWPER